MLLNEIVLLPKWNKGEIGVQQAEQLVVRSPMGKAEKGGTPTQPGDRQPESE